MTAVEVRALLDYHYWARDRLLVAVQRLTSEQFLRQLGSSFSSVRDTLAHTYSAEWIWLERWQGRSPSTHIPFDRFPDFPSLKSACMDLERQTGEYLAAIDDAGFARTMPYRLLNGTEGRSRLDQMVQHVVNHGSYHRGQVTTMLRQMGAEPPASLDLITFTRERAS
jgi:uncharacterized damage-inducible protein DinB